MPKTGKHAVLWLFLTISVIYIHFIYTFPKKCIRSRDGNSVKLSQSDIEDKVSCFGGFKQGGC